MLLILYLASWHRCLRLCDFVCEETGVPDWNLPLTYDNILNIAIQAHAKSHQASFHTMGYCWSGNDLHI